MLSKILFPLYIVAFVINMGLAILYGFEGKTVLSIISAATSVVWILVIVNSIKTRRTHEWLLEDLKNLQESYDDLIGGREECEKGEEETESA